MSFLQDFQTILKKNFLLARRKSGQTIVEILLAYLILGIFLGLRYAIGRSHNPAYQMPRFRPHDTMKFSDVNGNTTYYYPGQDPFFLS